MSDAVNRAIDLSEEYDTMMEVQRNPCGAWMAIQEMAGIINALSRLLSTSTGKEVMPDVPNANSTHQSDTAPAGLSAGGGAGQMADTPMITGLVASNLTARGNAATWALYDANLTRMGAVQPAHVNETPKSEHDAANMLTPATKGGDA